MKLVTVFFLLLVFSVMDYSSSQSQPASSPKGDASASASAKLPHGYVIISKTNDLIMAVKINNKRVTWNEARKACYHEGNGAFLAYADTKKEEDMYLKMMKKKKVNDVWVGIHDLFESNGEYSTIRGEVAKEAAHFTWFPGEPNSNNGPEPCGEYRIAHGKQGLNDRKCDKKFAYMCKIKIPQLKK